MSFKHQTDKPLVLKKALHWLNEQPDNWSDHIKESHIAVKMYLKSQNQNHSQESMFQKEIQQFVKEGESADKTEKPGLEESIGAILDKKTASVFSAPPEYKNISPPANRPTELFSAEDNSSAFVLDEQSLKTLKDTKRALNIKDKQEALRLLIQIGRSSLDKLLPPSSREPS